MSKEYKFNGKSYIIAKCHKSAMPCFGCAFDKESNNICHQFEVIAKAPDCAMEHIIFIEKPAINRFIVCLVDASYLAPADIPKIHTTRESAEMESKRLCKLYNKEFAVLQVVSAIKPQEPKKEVFA